MALRVLLADESSTIKRVMQLALQDFGVEVKSVPVGLDVLAVTKTFKPDIIFADVLLAKRNGYDVCTELKADPETHHIPVVLMWSGFMEVDEAKISQARPDARLEKPFDSETLRQLVQKSVPKTQSNPVSSYLQFPKMPEFSDERPRTTTNATNAQPQAGTQPQANQARPQTQTSIPLQRQQQPAQPQSQPRSQTQPQSQRPQQTPSQPSARPISSTTNPSIHNTRPGGKIPSSIPINFETLSQEAEHEDVFAAHNEPTYSGVTRAHEELPMIDNPDMDPDSNEMLVAMDEDFAAVPLQSSQQRDPMEDEGWTQQDLKKFKIQTPAEAPEDDFASRFVIPQDELEHAHVEVEGEFEEIRFGDELPPEPAARNENTRSSISRVSRTQLAAAEMSPPTPSPAQAPAQELNARDPALIERVIREEAREVIENICWKVIPEMVERIVREEINKILRDTEKSL